MCGRDFTLTLQTNEMKENLDLSKPAVPFVLGSQIYRELTYAEVSIGPVITWNVRRKIGHGLASLCVWGGLQTVCVCMYIHESLSVCE